MVEDSFPMVSVIAPCRNEAPFIENTLNSILQGDYPTDRLELFVVDGMSTDGTREIVQRMAAQNSRIKLLDNPAWIQATAMNIEIKAACGQYILRIDCHSTFASDYVSNCVEVLERTGAACVGGYLETLPGSNTLTGQAIALATATRFGVGGAKSRIGADKEQESDGLPFGAFQADVFEKVGIYHPLLVRNQDMELYSRIRKAGLKLIISPKIKVRYYNRGTFKKLRRQAFANGLWNAYQLCIVGGGLRPRHLIPACFVIGLTLLGVLGFSVRGKAAVPFWLYTGLYLLIGITESVRIALRERKLILAPFILITFVQLHLWYGWGTLWGFLTGPIKFRKDRPAVDVQDAGR